MATLKGRPTTTPTNMIHHNEPASAIFERYTFGQAYDEMFERTASIARTMPGSTNDCACCRSRSGRNGSVPPTSPS